MRPGSWLYHAANRLAYTVLVLERLRGRLALTPISTPFLKPVTPEVAGCRELRVHDDWHGRAFSLRPEEEDMARFFGCI